MSATQLLLRSLSDALFNIFDVADPTGPVILDSPAWVPCWHTRLLKFVKASIHANRDDTHNLHSLVHDLFVQLQDRLTS